MGWIKAPFANAAALLPARSGNNPITQTFPTWQDGLPQANPTNYVANAQQGYEKNEIIFSAIQLLATSASEPRVKGRRQMPNTQKQTLRDALKRQRRDWLTESMAGAESMPGHPPSDLMIDYMIKGLEEVVTDHPALTLLEHPNPFMSRYNFWATIFLHKKIAGNAYAWKARSVTGKPAELWILRPDRVKVIPDRQKFIGGYTYTMGSKTVEIPATDMLHFRTQSATNDYYGMPPLMPIMRRINIDNFMADFVASYFMNAGVPAGLLQVKSALRQEDKDEIRSRFRRQFGGPAGWFDLMVLDQTEASFTPMGQNLGQRGLVVPELDHISEARLSMVFGVPLSILGALLGQESSSYANKRADWQVLWDVTLTPEYVDLGDELNRGLLWEWDDLDELFFDLSMVKALQEDVDSLHIRTLRDVDGGVVSIEEARAVFGLPPDVPLGHHIYVPSRATLVEVTTEGLPAILGPAAPQPAPGGEQQTPEAQTVIEPTTPSQNALEDGRLRYGRPRLENDDGARALWRDAQRLREAHPNWTDGRLASELNISRSTLQRYKERFSEVVKA